ncbi:MAG: N-acetyl-gamma-glutamyl-phosphate reductase [Rhodospirillaceae bacterium]
MAPKVFIDGEAGTTGLELRQRLVGRTDIELLSIAPDRRKDPAARAELLNAADMVMLCLPDDAAKEAVSFITNDKTKVIDASTAFRVADGWTYGFPEMHKGHRGCIAAAKRVSNPGCYPTGANALLRPLVSSGLLPANYPVSVNAVSGYSGGGKSMIAEFEDAAAANYTKAAYRIYALELQHKHVPEIQKHSGLRERPIFAPAVGRYKQGMIVEVPLHLSLLPGQPTVNDVHHVLEHAYEGEHFVEVVPLEKVRALKTLEPEALNNTNMLKLYVFGAEGGGQARLVALLDNLGKGASGAAVQNMNIMLGLPETAGLA